MVKRLIFTTILLLSFASPALAGTPASLGYPWAPYSNTGGIMFGPQGKKFMGTKNTPCPAATNNNVVGFVNDWFGNATESATWNCDGSFTFFTPINSNPILFPQSLATLPIPDPVNPGRLFRLTDADHSIWIDTGTQWRPITGGPLDVTLFGAYGDGTGLTDAVTTALSPIVTSASASWTSSDIGKIIEIVGAGPAGAVLSTTILSINNPNSINLSVNADTSVNPATLVYGHDDTTAIQNAIEATKLIVAGTAREQLPIYIPPMGSQRTYLVSNLIIYQGAYIKGGGSHRTILQQLYTASGIVMSDDGVSPSKIRIEGVTLLGNGIAGNGIKLGVSALIPWGSEGSIDDVVVQGFTNGTGIQVFTNASFMHYVRSFSNSTGFIINGGTLLATQLIASNNNINFQIIGTGHRLFNVYSESATTTHFHFGDGLSQTTGNSIDGVRVRIKGSSTTPRVIYVQNNGASIQVNQVLNGTLQFAASGILTALAVYEQNATSTLTIGFQETTNTSTGFFEFRPDLRGYEVKRLIGGMNVTGAVNNGSGLIRITTQWPWEWATGHTVTIAAVGGTVEANGNWTITRVDATHFDLQGSAFVNPYTPGTGTIAPWVAGGNPALDFHTANTYTINQNNPFTSYIAIGTVANSILNLPSITASYGRTLNIRNNTSFRLRIAAGSAILFPPGSTTAISNYDIYSGDSVIVAADQNGNWQSIGKPAILTGSVAWDTGNILVGSRETKDVTVTDCVLGDYTLASMDLSIVGLTISSAVKSTNVVSVTLANNTAGAVDLAPATVKVRCWK